MEYRKLISFGRNSFVISLPKAWIRHNKLQKGDLIYVDEKESNLILGIKEHDVASEKSTTIEVDDKSISQLRREINAVYIENYRQITLIGSQLKEKSEELLKLVRELIALEVLEIDSKKIITKDFLSMEKVSVAELIKKMDMIVRSMSKDCMECFNEDNVSNIILRDKDVNRISFLIYRSIRFGLKNPSITLKNFDLFPSDLLNLYLITFQLEKIADETKRISRGMLKTKISNKEKEEFVKLLLETEKLYLEFIKSYYKKNRDQALLLSNKKTQIIKKINNFSNTIDNKDEGFIYMIDRFRHLIGCIHEMGRLIYQN
jgi:phosphate uptake regulator